MQIRKRHTKGNLHVHTNKEGSNLCFNRYCSCTHLHIWHGYVYEVMSVIITSHEDKLICFTNVENERIAGSELKSSSEPGGLMTSYCQYPEDYKIIYK